MRNKILPLMIIVATIFTGCSKQEIRELRMIFGGVVFDDCTGEPIDGVDLRLQRPQGMVSTTSDETGYFSFGDQYMGSYDLLMHKPGYLSWAYNIEPEEWYENDNVYDISYFDEYWMIPLSEKISANVYKQFGDDGTPTAAANVPFTIYLGEYNDPIEVVTDQFGYFELDSLPFDYEMTAKFDFASGGIQYKEKIDFLADTDQFVVNGYNPEGNFGIASINLLNDMGDGIENFGLNELIEVTFTQPVDTSFNPFGVSTGITSYSLDVGWFDNNMRATIGTADGWAEDTNHNFSIEAVNESNTQNFSAGITFRTGLGL